VFFFFGERMIGRVEACGDAHIATRFLHVYGVPLVPLRSFAVISEGEAIRAIPIALHVRSVIAGYARTLALMACFYGVAHASLAAIQWSTSGRATLSTATLFIGLFGLAAAWPAFRMGRLDAAQTAMRQAYAPVVGAPLDPAVFGQKWGELRGRALDIVAARSTQGSYEYRTHHNPRTHWLELALSPAGADRQLVAAALTLARLETWRSHTSEERRRWKRDHARLYERLCALGPSTATEEAA
jgi:hypothetical protein